MGGFLMAVLMMLMIFVFMTVQKYVFPRLGIENNASSRAVLCFVVIASSVALHGYLEKWFV